ncbi:MAG: c-type cytochrome [bacterium]
MKDTILSVTLLLAFVFLPGVLWAADEASFPAQRSLNQLETNYRQSAINGWRMFQTSFAEDKMACVNCHLNYDQMTGWAGGYPKVEVFNGTPYSVKTLHQVVLETLATHTDLPESGREAMAEDLAAYISWWGDGQPVTPGLSRDTKPASMDLDELAISVNAGKDLFYRDGPSGCTSCHGVEKKISGKGKIPLQLSFTTFPRYHRGVKKVITIDTFLILHMEERGYVVDRAEITSLAAFLADVSKGQVLRPGMLPAYKETINKTK